MLEVVALDVVTGVERGAAKVLGTAALKVVKGVGSGAARVLGVAALGLETHVFRCRGSRVHGSQIIVPRTRAYLRTSTRPGWRLTLWLPFSSAHPPISSAQPGKAS